VVKATLEFNLPEEIVEFDHVCKAWSYVAALEAVAQAFREKDKYSEEAATTWSEARELFWDTLKASGVELP